MLAAKHSFYRGRGQRKGRDLPGPAAGARCSRATRRPGGGEARCVPSGWRPTKLGLRPAAIPTERAALPRRGTAGLPPKPLSGRNAGLRTAAAAWPLPRVGLRTAAAVRPAMRGLRRMRLPGLASLLKRVRTSCWTRVIMMLGAYLQQSCTPHAVVIDACWVLDCVTSAMTLKTQRMHAHIIYIRRHWKAVCRSVKDAA